MFSKIKPYILPYSVAIAIPLAVGILSAFFTKENMSLYSEIHTPPIAPPGWLFPIVWTLLYALMGVSSCMIYLRRADSPADTRKALTYYAMSLVLNFAWSIIFFNFRIFRLAFVCILALLYLIIRTILEYRKIYPLASYLQIPYAVWVAFAGYLNLAISILN